MYLHACKINRPKSVCTVFVLTIFLLSYLVKETQVPSRVLWCFIHKASVTRVNAEANVHVHITDWLISVFVNELAPPRPMYAVKKVSACSSAEGL